MHTGLLLNFILPLYFLFSNGMGKILWKYSTIVPAAKVTTGNMFVSNGSIAGLRTALQDSFIVEMSVRQVYPLDK